MTTTELSVAAIAGVGRSRVVSLLDAAAGVQRQDQAPRHALGDLLRSMGSSIDVAAAGERLTADEPRMLLGRHPVGPVLALRRYEPGERSTVHAHAWTVILHLAGEGTVERWRAAGDGTAALRSSRPTSAGDVTAIAEGEAHRQRAGENGALELVVIGEYRADRPRVDLTPEPWSERVAEVIDRFVDAFRAADADAVTALYAPGVVLDLNVPQWRFQVQGGGAIAMALRTEEFQPGYHVARWRATPTGDGAAVELEAHFTQAGERRLARQLHLLRLDADHAEGGEKGIAEHTVYCTGVWDAATIARQSAEAPMVRA